MNVRIKDSYSDSSHADFEIVERKGLGHPDTLSDGLAESISIAYSRYCLEKYKVIPRHNVDKVMIMGGLAKIGWGHSEYIEPVRVLVNGRISPTFGGEVIPVNQIIKEEVCKFFKKRLPKLDQKFIKIIYESTNYTKNFDWFNPKSANELPEYGKRFANDTSSVVGHSPLTPTELLALKLEGHFYNEEEVPKYEFVGQDIKVMIIRDRSNLDITMCVPFFADKVSSKDQYFSLKDEIVKDLESVISNHIKPTQTYKFNVNTQDQMVNDYSSPLKLYFVAAGSSIDFGEEGVVGRGNSRSGIISSTRHYSMEAAWGKNPYYHVGKVLGYAVDQISKKISVAFDCDARVWMTTKMGDPLFEPNFVSIDVSKSLDQSEVEKLLRNELKERDWSKEIIEKSVLVPHVYKD